MEKNTNDAVFNLMQKVVDKLEEIETALKINDNKSQNTQVNERLVTLNENLKNIKTNQVLLNKMFEAFQIKTIDLIKENVSEPIINNFRSYSLFGADSKFGKKELIILLFGLLLLWSSIKYIPSFFTSYSAIVKEKEDYEFFYNYILLKQFESSKHITANKFLERIQQKDTVLINEYHELLNVYQYERRKQQLKEELRKLEKNDR